MTAHCSCLDIQYGSRKKKQNFYLNLGAWNVRTLQDSDGSFERKTALVSLSLKKHNISIAALSETRLAGFTQLEEVEGGYTFFCYGRSEVEHRQSGVGYAIKTEIAKSLPSLPKGISDRIMTLTLPLRNGTHATLVSCYAPTMSNTEQEKDNFYDCLRDTITKVKHRDKLILMGDFNARVGTDNATWDGVMGYHGVGRMNSNGLRLLSLCKEFNLCISNTFFQQSLQRKTSWMHPRSKDWHIIDYVICRRRDLKDISITRSFHSTCFLSDHALLRSKVSFCLARKRLRRSKLPKRINVAPLKLMEKREELRSNLENALDAVEITEDIESSWSRFRDVVYDSSLKTLGFPVRRHQDWFDDNNEEVKILISQMHDIHKAWINDKKSSVKHQSYKRCKGMVQTALRKMKENWWNDRAEEIQKAADMKDSKSFYEGLKKVYGPKESSNSPVLSADGETLHTDKSEILLRWKEHFESVLNSNSEIDEEVISSIPQRPEIPGLAFLPTFEEIKHVIKQLLCGKAPGKDGIPPEIFKYGGTKLIKKLLGLFLIIWEKGTVPQDFKDAFIKHLFKNKGSKNVCDNFRGISLLSIAGKILARLILNRIIQHLIDEIYPESQCGFRAGRGVIDMIFSLRQVAEKVREKNKELYMVFIDLTKAFDTVNREALWKVLKRLGIPDNMLSVIVSFHEGMKGAVVSDGDISDPFNVTNGTKQGCVMAPVLFALFFSVMLQYAFGDAEVGIEFQFRTDGGLFNHQRFKAKTKVRSSIIRDLLFADDAALVATSLEEAQELVDRFSKACRAFGLTISVRKTEVVHQPPPTPKQVLGVKQAPPAHQFPPAPITVDGQSLKYVKSFTYLGSAVNSHALLDDEIVNRIAKASNAFGKLHHRLWNERGIRLETKIKVYKAVVLSTLLFGSEAWTLYRLQINQLDVFHKRCLRSICGYTLEDRVSNPVLLEKCKIGGIETFLMQSQLRWCGHVLRMKDHRIPKILMFSDLSTGKRKTGRPLLRYKDKLKRNLSALDIPIESFEDLVRDRRTWRATCHEKIRCFEVNRVKKLREERSIKFNAAQPPAPANSHHSCHICGLSCRSLAGLKCHLRHKHN